MRIVSEQRVVLVEKGQLAKYIADVVEQGWQIDGTQSGAAYPKGENEVEVRQSKQNDMGVPAVQNGPK